MFHSVAHIGFTVSDLEKSVQFYKNILGCRYLGEMKMAGPETAALFNEKDCAAKVAYLRPWDETSPLIELIEFSHKPAKIDKPDLFKTSISELCFYTSDIDEDYHSLREKGVEFLSEPQTFDSREYGLGKSRAVYFFDPDGNVLELIQSLDS